MSEESKRGNIEKLFHEGNVITIIGYPGSGKTDKIVMLMERAVKYGFHSHTIINFFDLGNVKKAIETGKLRKGVTYLKKPDEIHVVKKLSDLLLGLFEYEKNIVVLDEAGLFVSSTQATSKRVRQLKQLTYIIRHLNACIVFVCQSKNSLVPELRSTLVTHQLQIKKISENNRMMIVSKPVPHVNDEGEEVLDFIPSGPPIVHLPSSQLAYDSKFLPSFKIDIDLNELLDDLADLDSVEVIEQGKIAVRKQIDKHKENEDYITTGQYMKKYNIVRSTVITWIKKGLVDYYTVPGRGKGNEYRIHDRAPTI